MSTPSSAGSEADKSRRCAVAVLGAGAASLVGVASHAMASDAAFAAPLRGATRSVSNAQAQPGVQNSPTAATAAPTTEAAGGARDLASETAAIGTAAAGVAVAGARARRSRKQKARRQQQVIACAATAASAESGQGFFKGVKDFISTKLGGGEVIQSLEQQLGGGEDGVSIVVSSKSPVGQPFCGAYQEMNFQLNGRTVYKKVGAPAGGQDVYLLYNEASQWVFTPHTDGRPDGWAFVVDPCERAEEIQGTFNIWNGSAWVPDVTLRPQIAGAAAAEEAAPEAAAAEAAAAVQHAVSQAAAPAVDEPARLPAEAELLAQMHFKSHWKASDRCLFDFEKTHPTYVNRPLPEHQGVRRGVLPNGLRYVILKNAMPPKRFEAHIELHVGSIDEEPHEQGIAHMMEHVCFLGSRKRERLIGTGSRSNALTDFQHTIYHIHAPVSLEDGRELYVPALEALHEIAFAPEMVPYRIEKERKAVLAEMQQVNDMEYRIETWTLSGLHETNKLGTQFPIGKEEQIKAWQQADLKAFHEKWYYPANATLYVVGDIPEEEMIAGITRVFEPTPPRHLAENGTATLEPVWGGESADARSLFRRKIARHRPEQLHNFSVPMIGTTKEYTAAASFAGDAEVQKPWHGPLRIFRNELLEGLQVNFYAKAPVRPLRTLDDIKHLVAVRILIGVLQFRIVSRYSSNHAPVQIDHSDSFREGCAVTSITVNADPRDWRNALACVVQEVRAICDHGITESEMKRYMSAMLKDVEKGVAENDTVPSEDHLNFIMTSDVFDHVVMHPEQSWAAFKEVAPAVDREMVNTTAKWMLGFLGFYGQSAAAPPTAIVVCTPTQVYEEKNSTWVPFNITEDEIVDLLLTIPDKSKEDALNQVDVPESLLKDQLEVLLANQPLDALTTWRAMSRKSNKETGVVQLMLPNGARVNYVNTSNESQGTMRLLVPGGRSADTADEIGSAMVGVRTISESGAVSTFAREQIELFAVSNLVSVHLDLSLEFSYVDASFSMGDNGLVAVMELLHLLFQEPRWELPAFVRAQQAYKAQAYAVQKSLEQSTLDRLMRMMYSKDPRVSEPSIDDLNKLTLAKVRKAVQAQFRPQDLEINLVADFEGRAAHKKNQKGPEGGLSTGQHREEGEEEKEEKAEEFSEIPQEAVDRRLQELDESIWRYLGSITPSDKAQCELSRPPVINHGEDAPAEERQRVAHLEDSDERAVANIGGGAPNRWGVGDAFHKQCMEKKNFGWDSQNSDVQDHPLYPSCCLLAMREVINTRLFSTVRDSLGLSYDCSFELSMFDRLEAGWYTCTVSAHPSRINEAVDAAKGVLQGVKKRPISELELSTARRTLMRRHETDLQSNEYWISLLTHLQYDNPKDISCIRDIEELFKKLRWNDLQNAYQTLLTDKENIFVSVSTAGPGASYISGGTAAAPQSTNSQSTAPKQLVELD